MRISLPILVFGLLSLSAFKTQDAPDAIKGKVKRVSDFLTGTYDEYFYDADGHFASVVQPNIGKLTHIYFGNMVYIDGIDPDGEKHKDTMILNGKGKVEKYSAPDYYIDYEYDEQGHRTKELEYAYKRRKGTYNYITQIDFKDGNLFSITYFDDTQRKKKQKASYFVYYDFYDKPNTLQCDAYGMNYAGLCSNNLLKIKLGITAKGDTDFYFNYRYQFDTAGRVIKLMKYYRNGQIHDSLGYTYY